eukprot:GHVR01012489.1.p1 GENE.GHVR01012489.1~~GHVR01012489.1.p1  ORF type:complete len:416 (-),score=141.14 GHVR01012489.1:183-1301(-)
MRGSPIAWDKLNLSKVASVFVSGVLPFLYSLKCWRPFIEPDMCLDDVRNWFELIEGNNWQQLLLERVAQSPESPLLCVASTLQNSILPSLRSVIINEWNPTDAECCLTAIQSHQPPILGVHSWCNLLCECVVPRLKNYINTWRPLPHMPTPQSIVFPWLPTFVQHERMGGIPLVTPICLCLCSRVVSILTPADKNTRILVEQVRGVVCPSGWQEIQRNVCVPNLSSHMTLVEVRPDKQRLSPLHEVLLWRGIVSDDILGHLLSRSFFPQWIDVLKVWLGTLDNNSNNDDNKKNNNNILNDVHKWYLHWKKCIPPPLLQQKSVEQWFIDALNLIKTAINNTNNNTNNNNTHTHTHKRDEHTHTHTHTHTYENK